MFNIVRSSQIRGCLADHLRWGDAFAVVYSVCERRSFAAAGELLALLERTRLPCAALTLLANKTDLEHARAVTAAEGQQLSLRFGCQFYEVSAAESAAGAALAFHALLREARALALLLPAPRRKLAAYSVSKFQSWLGNYNDPEDWGWKKCGKLLMPVQNSKPQAPPELLKLIFCKCKGNCGAMCGCQKAGMKCSAWRRRERVSDNVKGQIAAGRVDFEPGDTKVQNLFPHEAQLYSFLFKANRRAGGAGAAHVVFVLQNFTSVAGYISFCASKTFGRSGRT
ncbi:Ras-related and estrogen-regulated growth inhibitor [Eumeta japonica]|uniref:small monomeric GTPase n=1 Tax=Eumeta variegata TaxID=151549 RepID=A0A4C1Y335_EUMVA|nr:Ras-related and estrogen-regulated growth inhibitor [Eumeta japonica]